MLVGGARPHPAARGHVPGAAGGVEEHHGGDVGGEHLLETLEGPPGRTVHVQGRGFALGRPVEVEEDLVDLRQVLDALGQALAGLIGVLDEVSGKAAGHADEDELDGELHALVGIGLLAGEEQARQGHGQPGDDGHAGDDAQAAGEPGDDRGDAQGDEERRAGEAGGLHHGHAQGDLEEQRGGGLPPALLATDGSHRPPQGVDDEHAPGHRGAGPAVLDQPEGQRQGQRHPAHGAEDAAELGHVLGRGGPQVPPPEGGTPSAGRGGRHLVGKWFEHHCGRFPLGPDGVVCDTAPDSQRGATPIS